MKNSDPQGTRFGQVDPAGPLKERLDDVCLAFASLMLKLDNLCNEGRDLALVRTKLEEAHAFALKAVWR